MKKQINSKDIEKQIKKDPKFRRELARRSHYWFFIIYLSDYVKYKTAAFQRKMFLLTENEKIRSAVITAFRGSAKSTIMSLSYPIWAMITGQKKHIVILSQTQQLCKLILSNIRKELEENELLVKDFGPFREIADQWSQNTLLIPAYNCRITCISCGESIRGIRHRQYRPDLIICDDVEDLQSVRTKEARDKTYSWLTREVIPAGDKNTKIIIIGNKLHEDGLMMRLKKSISDNNFSAVYREYPLLDESGRCLWTEKFPSQAAIHKLKESIGSEVSWQREYLLKIIPEEDAIILRDWITYYDSLPEYNGDFRFVAIGIDLAISLGSRADFTAMVIASVFGYDMDLKIYIHSYPINKRLSFPDTVEEIKRLYASLGVGIIKRLFIEEVAYQEAVTQELVRQNYPAEGVKVMGSDKRQRLIVTTHLIKSGKILFPKKGCEELISQLVGFGYEAHDDLADAFAILIQKVLEESIYPPILIGRAY